MKTFPGLLAALVVAAGATAAAAADSTCVRLSQVDESPVVDDGTILLKLKNGDFKRIDMRGRCPSLKMSGFAHKTPSDDLCTSTVLRVRSPGAADCMIERIVDIDRAEADTLMKTR